MGVWKDLVSTARSFNASYEAKQEIERKKRENIRHMNEHPECGATCRKCKYFNLSFMGDFCSWGHDNGCEPEYVDISDPDDVYCKRFVHK